MKHYSTVSECPNVAECPSAAFIDLCESAASYQEQGYIGTFMRSHKDALREANQRINEARKATPIQYLGEYRSYIKWQGEGYTWGWVCR